MFISSVSYISPSGSFIYETRSTNLYLANLFFVAAHVGNEDAFRCLLTRYSLPTKSGVDFTDD